MLLRRSTFFILLFLVYIIMAASPRIIWFLRSEKATGIFSFEGKGNALDQIRSSVSYLYYVYEKDTIWFKAPPGLGLKEDSPVPVRFQPGNPEDVKLDNFHGIWLSTIVYGSLPMLVLLVCLVHPHIVPWRSRVLLIPRKPFIKIIYLELMH